MPDKDLKGSSREKLFGYNLQQYFDTRYVLADGDYRIIKALVIGVAGLILTAVILAALAWLLHAPK